MFRTIAAVLLFYGMQSAMAQSPSNLAPAAQEEVPPLVIPGLRHCIPQETARDCLVRLKDLVRMERTKDSLDAYYETQAVVRNHMFSKYRRDFQPR